MKWFNVNQQQIPPLSLLCKILPRLNLCYKLSLQFFIANIIKASYKHPDLPCDGSGDYGAVLYPHWYLQMTCQINSKFYASVSVVNSYCQKI